MHVKQVFTCQLAVIDDWPDFMHPKNRPIAMSISILEISSGH